MVHGSKHPVCVSLRQVLEHTSPTLNFNLYGTRVNLIRFVAKIRAVDHLLDNVSAYKVYDFDQNCDLDIIYCRGERQDHAIDDDSRESTLSNAWIGQNVGSDSGRLPTEFNSESQDASGSDDFDSQGQYIFCEMNFDLREWNADDVESNFLAISQSNQSCVTDSGATEVTEEETNFIGTQKIQKDATKEDFEVGPFPRDDDDNSTSQSTMTAFSGSTGLKSHEIREGHLVLCTGVARNLDGKVLMFAQTLRKITNLEL